jgi:hypothetical protein
MRQAITFRSRRTKRQLREAFGNANEKLNELLERELSHALPPDWREVLKRPAPVPAPKAYNMCLRAE